MPGFLTSGLPAGTVGSNAKVPVDTALPRGVNPASIGASALQVAATLMESLANATTATAGAVTSNQFGGVTTTGALTTVPGATASLTLSNSLITQAYLNAGGVPQASILSGTNSGGATAPLGMSANMQLVSIVPTVGQCIFTWMNAGDTALNGTMQVVWHL